MSHISGFAGQPGKGKGTGSETRMGAGNISILFLRLYFMFFGCCCSAFSCCCSISCWSSLTIQLWSSLTVLCIHSLLAIPSFSTSDSTFCLLMNTLHSSAVSCSVSLFCCKLIACHHSLLSSFSCPTACCPSPSFFWTATSTSLSQ